MGTKDFTWNELVRLFEIFGFMMGNKGKTKRVWTDLERT